jgi:arabinogalactan oligomer/maltooligosaccharide transport system substrate-binding protein
MKIIILLLLAFSYTNIFAKNITLWHAYRGKERKALENVAKVYEKENNIKINLLAIPYDAFDKKLTASIPRMQGPDVFIFANDKIGNWAESGLIETLNYYFYNKKRLFLTLMFDTTIKAMVYKNNLYAIPLAFKVPVLFYNKKYITTPPKTFEELIKISKEKMASNEGLFGLGYENTNFFFHSMFYFAFGGELFNDKKEVLINSEGAKKSYEYAKYLALETKIMPEEITSAVLTTLFNKDKLLFVINGPWFSAEIDQSVKYGVTAIPDIDDTHKAKPYMSNEGVFINKFSEKKEESIKFIRFLSGLHGGKTRMLEGEQSVSVVGLYKNKDKMSEKDEKLVAFKLQAESSEPISNSPLMSYFWAPMTQSLKKVLEQNVKIDEALNDAKIKIEKLLSK